MWARSLMRIAAEAVRMAYDVPEDDPASDRLRRIGIELRAIHDRLEGAK